MLTTVVSNTMLTTVVLIDVMVLKMSFTKILVKYLKLHSTVHSEINLSTKNDYQAKIGDHYLFSISWNSLNRQISTVWQPLFTATHKNSSSIALLQPDLKVPILKLKKMKVATLHVHRGSRKCPQKRIQKNLTCRLSLSLSGVCKRGLRPSLFFCTRNSTVIFNARSFYFLQSIYWLYIT